MKISRWIFCIAVLLLSPCGLSAQELILPLGTNPELKTEELPQTAKKALLNDTLELPFVDDFSGHSPWPDETLWTDRYAYINDNYPVDPPSLRCATLDAIDSKGALYDNALLSPKTFGADSLSSQPVNLDYPASDSIYLSFFYQPMGTGLQPDITDSLSLDFYNPDLDKWSNIWRVPGDTLRPFRQVMIAIKDTAYLKNGFRFRFRNQASLPKNQDYIDKRGNVDHWNIDYVRLDRNRSAGDTILRDVAFSAPLSSMVKDYEAMPWDHFQNSRDAYFLNYVRIEYFNNDTASRNITRYLNVKDLSSGEIYSPGSPSTQDIFPFTTATAQLSYVYPFDFAGTDTAHFEIKSYLRTDDFDNKVNDTITRTQFFRDYWAYDDGSAERAYGLRGMNTNNAVFAVRFEAFRADSLRGLYLYFTQLNDSLNLDYYFRFMVWDDNEGMPGNVIYEEDIDRRVFYADSLNRYKSIFFKEAVPIDGVFYVGIKQFTTYLLNIGMDINHSPKGNIVYNTGTGWKTSDAPGVLMIRPFVKRTYSVNIPPDISMDKVKVYPNPASEVLRFQFPGSLNPDNFVVDIHNISGQRLHTAKEFSNGIQVADLQPGIYIATFRSEGLILPSTRFIISR